MSSTVSWRVGTRRVMLAVIGLASVGAAVGVQFAPVEVLDVRSASTAQLAGVLGLLVLPLVTVGAILADRRFLARRRVARAVGAEAVLSAVRSESVVNEHKPAATAGVAKPSVHGVEIVPAGAEKAPVLVHAGGPRVAVVGGAARAAMNAGPRFEIVVENKPPRPQIVTLYAPVRGGAAVSKTAA